MSDEFSSRDMEKFMLLVKRTQEGKTFTCINAILTRMSEDETTKRSVHIVYTMNTLLNNRQFALRLKDIEKAHGAGSVVVFSSKRIRRYECATNLRELKGMFLNASRAPRLIIQCSNPTRFEDGVSLIADINEAHGDKLRVFMYYDEIHEYINVSREKIQTLQSMSVVTGVLGLTATPGNVYTKSGPWSRLRTMNIDDIESPYYCGVQQHHFILQDIPVLDVVARELVEKVITDTLNVSGMKRDESECEIMRYIASVLVRHRILVAGARVFVPASRRRVSHEMVRDYLYCINPETVVVVLNGVEKTMQYYTDEDTCETLPIVCEDEEVADVISHMCHTKGLKSRPLAITGLVCVSMGQTLTCEAMGPLTDAIFSHLNLTNEDASQLFGRTTGRMLNWDTYVPTRIYCPKVFMQRCVAMETMARQMTISGGSVTSKEDYYATARRMTEGEAVLSNIRSRKEDKSSRVNRPSYENHLEEFVSLEALNERLVSLDSEAKPVKVTKRNIKSGTYVFSLGGEQKKLTAAEIRREVSSGTKYFGDDIKKADAGKIAHRFYIGYEGERPVFFLRWAIKK